MQKVTALTPSSRSPLFYLPPSGKEAWVSRVGYWEYCPWELALQQSWQKCQYEGGLLRDLGIHTSTMPHPRGL